MRLPLPRPGRRPRRSTVAGLGALLAVFALAFAIVWLLGVGGVGAPTRVAARAAPARVAAPVPAHHGPGAFQRTLDAAGRTWRDAQLAEARARAAALARRRRAAAPAPPAPAPPPAPEASIPAPSYPGPRPTRDHPLNLLVTGDSLSAYVGQQVERLTAPSGLVRVTTRSYVGSGLTVPGNVSWPRTAEQEVSELHPGAVVVLLGANDGYNLGPYGPTTAGWGRAYDQRVASLMRTFVDGARSTVFWATPSAVRSDTLTRIYANENRFVPLAADAVPGAHYVDVFRTIAGGRYTDAVNVGGRTVPFHQSDGIHYTLDGAALPASMIVRALERQYGPLTR